MMDDKERQQLKDFQRGLDDRRDNKPLAPPEERSPFYIEGWRLYYYSTSIPGKPSIEEYQEMTKKCVKVFMSNGLTQCVFCRIQHHEMDPVKLMNDVSLHKHDCFGVKYGLIGLKN